MRKNKKAFDLRPLKSIAEHKRMIGQLFYDLSKDKRVAEEYAEIVNMSEKMVILAAKYNFLQNFNYEKRRPTQ